MTDTGAALQQAAIDDRVRRDREATAKRQKPGRPDGLPRGFKIERDGVYLEVAGIDGAVEWRWICSPIRVLALPRGADGKGWGRLAEVTDPDGRQHRVALPAELFAADGAELRRELMRLGLHMDSGPRSRAALSDLLQRWRPVARAMTTQRRGWADETCSTFVLGDGDTIGVDHVVYQSEHLRGASDEMFARGNVEGWRDNVAALCAGNPLAVFAVSLALSGPLLLPMKHEGGGAHLRGESSRGKSTLLRSAASVWGSPAFVQSWRATDNGLEGVACTCNSALVALDEMSEIDARKAGATIYMLANGCGKHRAGRSGAARPVTRWCTAILSSGEVSLGDKMAEAGQRKRAGQDVRLIDVKADDRAHGCFDVLHGAADGAAFSERLSKAAANYHGTAGPAFVRTIVDDMVGATEAARSISAGFVAEAQHRFASDADGQVLRVLRRIGLIVAAGEMATAAGITGWTGREVVDAGLTVFRSWLATRGGSGAQEDREAIERTRAFLVAHGAARFEDIDAASGDTARTINRAGWKTGTWFLVARSAWAAIHAGFDADSAARAVRDAGFLQSEADRLTMRAPRGVVGRPRCYKVAADIMGGADD